MINTIKLEILSKNKDFDLLFNNLRDKYFFSREDKINEILEEKSNTNDNVEKTLPICGCPYDEEVRHATNLAKVSHIIKFICKENGKYYGYVDVLSTSGGKIIKDAEQGGAILGLRPVYNENNEILTFDISITPKDWHRNELIKKILQRR